MFSSLVFVCSIVGNGWFGPQKNTSNRVSSGPTYPTRDVRRVFVNILCLLKKRQKMRRHAASKFLHFKFRNPAPPTSPPMPSSALLGDAGGCTPGARLISSPPPPPLEVSEFSRSSAPGGAPLVEGIEEPHGRRGRRGGVGPRGPFTNPTLGSAMRSNHRPHASHKITSHEYTSHESRYTQPLGV